MKKRKDLRILLSVIFIFCMTTAVFTACQKEEEPIEITVMDETTEVFDGEEHPVIATASKDGCLSYLYEGIDNKYFSPYAPSQPGEYNVKVTYKASENSNDSIIKNVKLNIELPFELDETGCFISKYKGESKNMVIPSTYRDKNIIGFTDDMNYYFYELESIKAPLTEFYINGIDDYKTDSHFIAKKLYISGNTKLKNGFPGTTVEYYDEPGVLKDGVFEDVWGIDEFTVPSSVMRIEENALAGLKAAKITLNSNLPLYNKNLSPTIKTVTVAPSYAGKLADKFFKDVKTVEKIEILSGVNIIGNETFIGCDGLKELTFNTAVDYYDMGENCFSADFVLEKLTIPEGFCLRKLGGKEYTEVILSDCIEMEYGAFKDCIAIKKIILPDTLKKVSQDAFRDCSNLTEVVLPKDLEEIDYYAFDGTALTSIDLPDTIVEIKDGTFDGCKNLVNVKFPKFLKEIKIMAFYGCQNLATEELPSSLEVIGDHAFAGCSSLKINKLPDSIKKIGEDAFWKCYRMNIITLPEGLTEIADAAFSQCSGIKEMTLPKSLKKIGEIVFGGCYMLTKLYITSEEMPVISEKSLIGMGDSCIIFVPAKLLDSYKEAFPKLNFSAIENS